MDTIRKLGQAKVGDTVQVELSKFDRGPLDCNYLLAYITEINDEHSLYKFLFANRKYVPGLPAFYNTCGST